MQQLLTPALILLLSGCGISQFERISVDSPYAKHFPGFCDPHSGFSNDVKNNSFIETGDFHFKLCMINDHRVALDSFVSQYPVEWIKVTNLKGDSLLTIDSNLVNDAAITKEILFSTELFRGNPGKLNKFPDSTINLKRNEFIWIGLPLNELPSLRFHSNENNIMIDLKRTRSYEYFQLTV